MIDSLVDDDRLRKERRVRAATLIVLLAALVLLGFISLCSGPLKLSVSEVLGALLQRFLGTEGFSTSLLSHTVIWELRLPRIVAGILVGAILAASGAVMQGLFRNPLADPALIGVSSGAAVGAVIAIGFGSAIAAVLPEWGRGLILPAAAFAGGLSACAVIFRMSRVDGQTVVPLMLLTGIAINALAGAVIGLFVFVSDDDQLRTFTFWSLGSLARGDWTAVAITAPLILLPLSGFLFLTRSLNSLLLGEAESYHLGTSVQPLKRTLVLLCACGVGAAVSLAGMIGFVGLVVPHLIRIVMGPDYRFLLPASAISGALLLLVADLVSRTAAAPAEVPVGVTTALLGAPFFLFLLRSTKTFMAG